MSLSPPKIATHGLFFHVKSTGVASPAKAGMRPHDFARGFVQRHAGAGVQDDQVLPEQRANRRGRIAGRQSISATRAPKSRGHSSASRHSAFGLLLGEEHEDFAVLDRGRGIQRPRVERAEPDLFAGVRVEARESVLGFARADVNAARGDGDAAVAVADLRFPQLLRPPGRSSSFSATMPLRFGPRKNGQSAARAVVVMASSEGIRCFIIFGFLLFRPRPRNLSRKMQRT